MKASTQGSDRKVILSLATLFAILATLSVNVLSNFFPIQGLNIGEIANTVLQGVLITPANYAFAIWGLIYLGLIAYGIYQLLPAQRHNSTLQRVNVLLIIACLAQIAWVYLFTLQLFWLSVVAMLAILLPLVGAYLQLDIGKKVAREFKWLVHAPFSIYLGWISVATIVNIASALYISGWDSWGINAVGWTVIMLLIGAAIASVVAIQRADIAFILVFVWAYVAIAIRHLSLNNPAISITAVITAIVFSALLAYGRMRRQSVIGSRKSEVES